MAKLDKNMEMLLVDSEEAIKLEQLIEDKKDYLSRLDHGFARQKVQEEIIFLEGLLPIILNETMVLYHEVTKEVNAKIHAAVKENAHAILLLISLRDSGDEPFRLATVNPHWGFPHEGLEISYFIAGRELEEVVL